MPVALEVLQFRCAREACGATWRILPAFLARHLWHAWNVVERIARPAAPAVAAAPAAPAVAAAPAAPAVAAVAAAPAVAAVAAAPAVAAVAAVAAAPRVAARTRARWRSRLASSARVLVAVLAISAGVVLEEVAKRVGLTGTRGDLVCAYVAMTAPPASERLSSLAALIHRLERGLRLM
jgi:hypothetical protein